MTHIELVGDLVFASVTKKRKQFIKAIEQGPNRDLVVDMHQVTNADSSALALMLEGRRVAKQNAKVLCYQKVPQKVLKLAKFCRLDKILQL